MQSITLIGMPGSGKSTVGAICAKRLGFTFLDLDAHIASKEGKTVGEIVNEEGGDALSRIEAAYALAVPLADTVLAPGGSIVYSAEAMERLKKETTVIFLDVPLDELRSRLGDASARGIVGLEEKSLDDIYAERLLLYQRYADIKLGMHPTIDGIVEEILSRVRE